MYYKQCISWCDQASTFIPENSVLAISCHFFVSVLIVLPMTYPTCSSVYFRPCVKKEGGGRYALKCLHDTPKSQTEVNLHMMCSKHPNIVKVLDVYANDLQFPGDKQPR